MDIAEEEKHVTTYMMVSQAWRRDSPKMKQGGIRKGSAHQWKRICQRIYHHGRGWRRTNASWSVFLPRATERHMVVVAKNGLGICIHVLVQWSPENILIRHQPKERLMIGRISWLLMFVGVFVFLLSFPLVEGWCTAMWNGCRFPFLLFINQQHHCFYFQATLKGGWGQHEGPYSPNSFPAIGVLAVLIEGLVVVGHSVVAK